MDLLPRLSGLPLFTFGLVMFALLLAAPGLNAAKDEELLLSPERVGAIHRASSHEELRQIYGAARVRDHLVQVGEGFVCRGTKIDFPDGDSLEITWRDETTRRGPNTVAVLGDRWTTLEGLRLGSTLQEIEAMNGGPFNLSGFGWDYGGTVGTWNGGVLANLAASGPPRLIVRLSPARTAYNRITREQHAAVTGDGALVSSAHDAMQALAPQVSQIIVDFAAGDCAAFFAG